MIFEIGKDYLIYSDTSPELGEIIGKCVMIFGDSTPFFEIKPIRGKISDEVSSRCWSYSELKKDNRYKGFTIPKDFIKARKWYLFTGATILSSNSGGDFTVEEKLKYPQIKTKFLEGYPL